MAVETRLDIDTRPFILYEYPAIREDKATILQDAGRVTVLAQYTLMAKASSGANAGKWVPYTSLTAVDGTAVPTGIYMGEDIAAADLAAGDVVDSPIITGGVKFDRDKLVFDGATRAYTDEFVSSNAAAVYNRMTIEQILIEKTLIPQSADSNTSFENV